MHEPSVRVVRRDQLSDNTPQTPGLQRAVAFDSRNPDAKVLSAFLSTVLPGAATGAHHHGDQETILYVLEGTARYRWGERLQHVVEAGPGDFVFIPAHTVHQEINASPDRPTVWVVTRSNPDPIVVNLPELDKYAEPGAREYPIPDPATRRQPRRADDLRGATRAGGAHCQAGVMRLRSAPCAG
jgi:uncharacterized RmlC-like cupin family protein